MKISTNLITREQYIIPDILDDSVGIETFLSQNKKKKVIVVQGLGFVGAVMSLVCANALTEEYAVIGVDLANESTFWKIKSINNGQFPLIADDPKIDKFFDESKRKGNFYATYDPLAYRYANVVIVDINLDVKKNSEEYGPLKNFNVDLKGFKEAITLIGSNCREDVLILVETTVPPGTCEQIVKPIIEKQLTHRGLSVDKYKLGHSYERVMPGPEYIDSIREFPRVYAGCNVLSADSIADFLGTIINTKACELTRLQHTNASEMCKVLENSYRAMNISFAIEWSRFAEEAGVNLYEMVDAIRVRKTHANLMYPGIGVGGYCLTKDPLLASWARKEFFGARNDLEMSVNSVSANDQMPVFAFNRLIDIYGDLKRKRVAILGISYRGDVGDTRFSPVETLFKKVKIAGGIVRLHDPFVSFWEEQKCDVEKNIMPILESNPDLIIISAGHSLYKSPEVLSSLLGIEKTFIYDTVGLLGYDQILLLQNYHRVSVLGRGDL